MKEMEENLDDLKKKIAYNIYKYEDDYGNYGILKYK